jgi:hypothetical protein
MINQPLLTFILAVRHTVEQTSLKAPDAGTCWHWQNKERVLHWMKSKVGENNDF